MESKIVECSVCRGRGSKACKNVNLCKVCCIKLQCSTVPPAAPCGTHKLTITPAISTTKIVEPEDTIEDMDSVTSGIDVQAHRGTVQASDLCPDFLQRKHTSSVNEHLSRM